MAYCRRAYLHALPPPACREPARPQRGRAAPARGQGPPVGGPHPRRPPVAEVAAGLGRAGDDLIITVGALRRRVRLAPVLRRCIVEGAALRGSELTVRFRPDPEVWPV